jgi:hypothetical protein
MVQSVSYIDLSNNPHLSESGLALFWPNAGVLVRDESLAPFSIPRLVLLLINQSDIVLSLTYECI